MGRPTPFADEGSGLPTGSPTRTSVAGYFARERQKDELRHERDRLVLDLARELGEQGLAVRLSVTRAVLEKILAGARERLAAGASSAREPATAAGSPPVGRDRWPDADSHYEALGRLPTASGTPAGLPR